MRAHFALRLAAIALVLTVCSPSWASAQAAFDGRTRGGLGGMDAEGVESEPRPIPRAAMTPEAARTWMKLQQKVPMDFPEEIGLKDLLAHIREATSKDKEEDDPGLAIYLDPVHVDGEAQKSENAPVSIHLEGLPLATTLRLALRQLDLTYYVLKDGLVLITSPDGSSFPDILDESVPPVSARAARIWEAMTRPISMPFAEETPLEDVLRYIKQATTSPTLPEGLPIYVDPIGLTEAEKSQTSPVRINLEGLPLAVSLQLVLDQLDLGYHVNEQGYLHVTHSAKARALSMPPTWERLADLEAEVERLREENEGLRKATKGQPMGRGPAFQSLPAVTPTDHPAASGSPR